MTDKPSYLGLLNAIAVAESAAEDYFGAWAAVTPSPEVRQVLQTVALREGEHGKAFAKRICELGYETRPKDDPGAADRLAIAASTSISDREKFEKLGIGQQVQGDAPDVFDPMFGDKNIDIQTGALLGRYIAEERDSGRLLRSCYEQCAAADAGGNGQRGESNGDLAGRVAHIEDLLQQVLARLG
ncbi:MAG: hypothetical protein GEV08_02310 [Acidimicrobiia bacterium]|nr:hypothetical protein [Acidimicrobiia bacterium]